jgi:hypothetical protein
MSDRTEMPGLEGPPSLYPGEVEGRKERNKIEGDLEDLTVRPDIEFAILSLASIALLKGPREIPSGLRSFREDITRAIANGRGTLNDLAGDGVDLYTDEDGPLAKSYRLTGVEF